MKQGKPLFIFLLLTLCAAAYSYAQKSKVVYVAKAGTLAEMLTVEESNEIVHLRLQGKLNAEDFRLLRDEFKQLRMLDMSETSISLYAGKNGPWNGFHLYTANSVPPFAFCRQENDSTFRGKGTLRRVILPPGLKEIGKAAFKGCENLIICQIRSKKAPRIEPEALTDSLTAVFIPKGCRDAYQSREDWKAFAVIEGEPAGASLQISRMGSLASELLQKGKRPNDINFLRVEGKLDEADFALMRDYMPNLAMIDMQNCNTTAIPDYTFTQKKYLLKVVLPKGLKAIGQRTFSGCTRLCGTLVLPPTVTAIEFGAFMGCDNLRHVIATGNSLTTLGDKLFGDSENKLIRAQ